jgi:hypothetical protein
MKGYNPLTAMPMNDPLLHGARRAVGSHKDFDHGGGSVVGTCPRNMVFGVGDTADGGSEMRGCDRDGGVGVVGTLFDKIPGRSPF